MLSFLFSGTVIIFSFLGMDAQAVHPVFGSIAYTRSQEYADPSAFLGQYDGFLGQSPIIIVLEQVNENGIAAGYSIHKNLKRPFSGTWLQGSGTTKIQFFLNEPGDNKYDGRFEILMDPETFEAEGNWFPQPNSGLSTATVKIKKQKHKD